MCFFVEFSSFCVVVVSVDFSCLKYYQGPRIIIHRIVGNDLPPLQSPGQLYYNIKYVLDHESMFEGKLKKDSLSEQNLLSSISESKRIGQTVRSGGS